MGCHMMHCLVLNLQCFCLWKSNCPSVLLSTRNKRVAKAINESQTLNLVNNYHKDATQLDPGITERFEESPIIPVVISQQIDEPLGSDCLASYTLLSFTARAHSFMRPSSSSPQWLCSDIPAMDGQWRSSHIVSVRTNRVLNKH